MHRNRSYRLVTGGGNVAKRLRGANQSIAAPACGRVRRARILDVHALHAARRIARPGCRPGRERSREHLHVGRGQLDIERPQVLVDPRALLGAGDGDDVLALRQQPRQRELRGRAITRDLDWGVTIPVGDYPEKRIYVWYDAVIGYLSAAIEWAKVNGTEDAWMQWWDADTNPAARIYNFIGKDNIIFHTIVWPGMLIGWNAGPTRMNLPYDVPANEYLNFRGAQFSTSRGNVIGWNTVLREFQADAWRYVLTAMAPESSDVEFTWQDFMDRINNELVANWGNLVNRMLGFAYKRFDGVVPTPGALDETSRALLDEIKAGFDGIGELYNTVKLKAALTETRRLSQRVNQYLNDKAPWKSIGFCVAITRNGDGSGK